MSQTIVTEPEDVPMVEKRHSRGPFSLVTRYSYDLPLVQKEYSYNAPLVQKSYYDSIVTEPVEMRFGTIGRNVPRFQKQYHRYGSLADDRLVEDVLVDDRLGVDTLDDFGQTVFVPRETLGRRRHHHSILSGRFYHG